MQNRYNAELSFWEKESYFGPVDVAIIGSGIVGLNAAWHLKRTHPTLNVTVLERGVLPTGASSRNAGFACFGTVSELLDNLTVHTPEEVARLVEMRWLGLQKLRSNLGDEAIDFRNYGGYELFFPDSPDYEFCLRNIDYLNKLLEPVLGHAETYRPADDKINQFGFAQVSHLLACQAEGQIHTGKMITALTKKAEQAGVTLLLGQEVQHLHPEENGVVLELANQNQLKARRVLVCTNGFARRLLPDLPVIPARAQVLVTAPIPDLKLEGTFHFDHGYYYFRNIGNRVLFGGARNLDFAAEETDLFGLTSQVQKKLEQYLKEVILPETEFTVEQRWSGIMGMGPGKGPIIKQISGNVFCAVRLSGTGVAIGSQVGEEAAELVLGSL